MKKMKIKLQATMVGRETYCFLSYSLCLPGATPLLLLPEKIRIRRFNLQTEAYHDFLQEEERIMALDYDWDHNNTGFSKSHTDWVQDTVRKTIGSAQTVMTNLKSEK